MKLQRLYFNTAQCDMFPDLIECVTNIKVWIGPIHVVRLLHVILYIYQHSQIFRQSLTDSEASAEKAYLSDAQDLAIDSVNAYMYWTTSQSLECARLNGQDYFEYQRTADFSGERIAGLTLDLDEGVVYWFVLSFVDGAQQLALYKAAMAGYRYVV